jgi:hypothetical protein
MYQGLALIVAVLTFGLAGLELLRSLVKTISVHRKKVAIVKVKLGTHEIEFRSDASPEELEDILSKVVRGNGAARAC